MKRIHRTDKAPAPVGPYSQAVEANGFLFCSGQIAIDPKSGEVFLGDIREQTKRVMSNVRAVLEAANLNFSHVVKSTIFLTNMNDFSHVNEVYASFFPDQPPARSTVAVAGLPKGVHVEIEVVAATGR